MTTSFSDSIWEYKNPYTDRKETFQILKTSGITRSYSLVLIPADKTSVRYLCEKINNFKKNKSIPNATLASYPSIEFFVFKSSDSNNLFQLFSTFTTELDAKENVINTNPNQ